MAANITRSISTVKAYALILSLDENGNPTVDKSDAVVFTSTNPTETEAYKALKNAGIKCEKRFVRFEIVETKVYAMTLDEFIAAAHVVERGKGGYIRKSQMTDSAPEYETEDSE